MSRLLFTALAAVTSCYLLLTTVALAANGEATPLDLGGPGGGAPADPTGGGGGLVRTIVGLAVVLAVIYGLHWVLKQVKASKQQRHSGHGLGSLASLPLGANRALHLVRAGAEIVLVGVGEGGVTPIRVYTEAEARRLGLLADDDEGVAPSGGVSLPALMDAGPETLPHKLGAALRRRATLGRIVNDLRARTVLR